MIGMQDIELPADREISQRGNKRKPFRYYLNEVKTESYK